jgi:hypothetical protein
MGPSLGIEITKRSDRYEVSLSPPEGPTWRSSKPLTATEVLAKLTELGCHSTDITDALYDADPGWSRKHDAHVKRMRTAKELGLGVIDGTEGDDS